jgi:2-dehydropantoate 2-reductase
MTIGIAGGGGIGSYYAALLARAGQDVVLLTRGAHLDAVRQRGLELRTSEGASTTRPTATDDADRLGDCEVVLAAVKGYSLDEVAPVLAAAGARGATIVPLLNGIDVAERLEARGVPRRQLAGGLARVSVVRTAPGVVERKSAGDVVVVGELASGTRERLERLVRILRDTGSNATVSDDIRRDLWRKFAFIVPMTVACGLSRTSIGPLLASERGRALLRGALSELAAVSRAGGAGEGLSDDDEAGVGRDLLALQPQLKPSFLLDLERGGPTELDLLAGTVSRMGRERKVPTPIHDVAVAAFEVATAQ